MDNSLNNDNLQKKRTAYSYHTFIFPFTWDCEGDRRQTFIDFMEGNSKWVNTDLKDKYDITSMNGMGSIEDCLTLYKEYQYFHSYARKAIYGMDEGIVHNYSFISQSGQLGENAKYIIVKGDKKYTLAINALRLKIFNTGIALWILECENHEDSQANIEAVKAINDWGRRIALPVLEESYDLFADGLAIEINDTEKYESDFIKFIREIKETKPEDIDNLTDKISMTHICDFIKKTIDTDEDRITSRPSKEKDKIHLEAVLDDRMYVMSFVCDEKYVGSLLGTGDKERTDNDPNYPYMANDALKNSLYELIYVDRDGECSVKNKELRGEQIEEAMYKRWFNCGTMFFITEYSFILLMQSVYEPVVETFLTQYYQMFCLVIAQRSSIMKFKKDAAYLSSEMASKGSKISKSTIMDIMELEKRFVTFDGQLCFEEASPQKQGIELFSKMKKNFSIDREKEALKEQLEALYEVANSSMNFSLNKILLIFTWIAAFISVASMIISSMQIDGFVRFWGEGISADAAGTTTLPAASIFGQSISGWVVIISLVVSIIGSVVAWVVVSSHYSSKKPKRKQR